MLCAYYECYDNSDKIEFPFRQMRDENDNRLPLVCLTAFFREDAHNNRYYQYMNNGMYLIGCTAYKSFPRKISDPSEDHYHHRDKFNYISEIRNWLSCLNPMYDSGKYGFSDWNRLVDISESDFYDIDDHHTEKIYDFIYICLKDSDDCPLNGWNAINRNFSTALKCFPIMVNKFGLKKGLIIGRMGCGLEQMYPDFVVTDFLKWHELQDVMKQSRFLFVPNIYDASPRVVAECLTKGLPVLMNRSILCGYKYICRDTGEFFIDEYDIETSLEILLKRLNTGRYDTRKWWNANYGIERSGMRLRNFIYNCLIAEKQESKNNFKYDALLKQVENIKQIKFVV